MGFYLRKSIKVGPIRFNLSKSGIGVSAGITGFRVGTGPRGNYIQMGRGGIYYRKTLPSGNGRASPFPPQPSDFDGIDSSVGPMVEIESADVAQMSDSSSTDLLQELQDKKKKVLVEPIIIVVAAIALGGGVATDLDPIALVVLAVISAIATYFARRRDILAKTVVLFYAFDAELEQAYAALHDGASKLAACAGCWHIAASGRVYDRKYHAGASSLVDRKSTKVAHASPPFLKTNIDTISIGVGRQTIYLFPDRALVYEAGQVGAIGYEQLKLSVTQTRFIEDSAPADARVVDRTWHYVNKRGGQDLRFSNNRGLPICLYDELHFASSTGLNEIIQVSRSEVGKFLEVALTALRAQVAAAGELHRNPGTEGTTPATSEIDERARNGRQVAVAFIGIVSAAILVGIVARMRQQRPPIEAHIHTNAAVTTPANAPAFPALERTPSGPARLPVTATAPSTPARSLVPTPSSPKPGASWVAKTTRAVRAKMGGKEVLIPKGVQLQVVGRSASDVLVSYGGSTATIPASATDLR